MCNVYFNRLYTKQWRSNQKGVRGIDDLFPKIHDHITTQIVLNDQRVHVKKIGHIHPHDKMI